MLTGFVGVLRITPVAGVWVRRAIGRDDAPFETLEDTFGHRFAYTIVGAGVSRTANRLVRVSTRDAGDHQALPISGLRGGSITNPPLVGETTGTCVSIITPDAERTMRTCLAVSSHLAAKHVPADKIAASEWLFVEGYVFANPATGQHAVREALRAAKEAGTKVALTCSDAFVPQVFGDAFREALAQSDLLFCNATEAMAVAGGATAEAAFAKLRTVVPNAVVTDGPNGAFVRYHGSESHAPAFPCKPVDVTGAGDMFAGSFM